MVGSALFAAAGISGRTWQFRNSGSRYFSGLFNLCLCA
jgi:hypothetical protein